MKKKQLFEIREVNRKSQILRWCFPAGLIKGNVGPCGGRTHDLGVNSTRLCRLSKASPKIRKREIS